jgi:hypothetical protein
MMERERAEEDQGTREASSKRPYRAPALRRLGTVQELTLAVGTVNATEPIFSNQPKASP